MASAWARTMGSLTSLAKWFQLFQPIGGVAASFTFCAAAMDDSSPEKASIAKESLTNVFIYSPTKAVQALLFTWIAKPDRDGMGCFFYQCGKSGNFFRRDPCERPAHAGSANYFTVGIENGSSDAAGAKHSLFVVQSVSLQTGFHQILLQLCRLRKSAWREPLEGQ